MPPGADAAWLRAGSPWGLEGEGETSAARGIVRRLRVVHGAVAVIVAKVHLTVSSACNPWKAAVRASSALPLSSGACWALRFWCPAGDGDEADGMSVLLLFRLSAAAAGAASECMCGSTGSLLPRQTCAGATVCDAGGWSRVLL